MTWDPHDPLDAWLDAEATGAETPCLDDNVLAGLCEGRLTPAEREAAAAHLAGCAACRAIAGDLLEDVPSAPRARSAGFRARPWFAAAAVLLAGLVAAWWFTRRGGPEAPPSLEVAVARIAPGVAPLDDAELSAPPSETLRGAFRVLAPRGTVLTSRPTLAWEPVPGAGGYAVRLVGEEGVVWERTVATDALDYPADAPALAEGARYVLEVTAEGVAVDPAGTSFAVATAEARAAWAHAVEGADAHLAAPLRWLALAHVALRRGHLAEAADAARRYADAVPDDPRGAAVLRRLGTARR